MLVVSTPDYYLLCSHLGSHRHYAHFVLGSLQVEVWVFSEMTNSDVFVSYMHLTQVDPGEVQVSVHVRKQLNTPDLHVSLGSQVKVNSSAFCIISI